MKPFQQQIRCLQIILIEKRKENFLMMIKIDHFSNFEMQRDFHETWVQTRWQ